MVRLSDEKDPTWVPSLIGVFDTYYDIVNYYYFLRWWRINKIIYWKSERGSTIKTEQDLVMTHDPANGATAPYPSHAAQWRAFHGNLTAWLFDPWSGLRRNAADVGSDISGLLIVPFTLPPKPVFPDDTTVNELEATKEELPLMVYCNFHQGGILPECFVTKDQALATTRMELIAVAIPFKSTLE